MRWTKEVLFQFMLPVWALNCFCFSVFEYPNIQCCVLYNTINHTNTLTLSKQNLHRLETRFPLIRQIQKVYFHLQINQSGKSFPRNRIFIPRHMSAGAAAGVPACIKGIGKGKSDAIAFIHHVILSTGASGWNHHAMVRTAENLWSQGRLLCSFPILENIYFAN